MAYVAISEKFKSDLSAKLRMMRRKEIDAVPEVVYRLNSTRPDLLAHAWGKHLHLKAIMPAEWCRSTDSLQIRVELPERGTVMYQMTLTPEMFIPPLSSSLSRMNISADDPEIKPYIDHEQVLYEIGQRWNKVDAQIKDFFNKCKSLNEAVKLWPQVTMYIPSEYTMRMEEKRDRHNGGPSAAAEALKNMDTDHLTTAAVISRMSGEE